MTREARAMVMSRGEKQGHCSRSYPKKSSLRRWYPWLAMPCSPDSRNPRHRFYPVEVGCFRGWSVLAHGRPSHFKAGQSGSFWDKKIEANRRRDAEVTRQLVDDGWTIVRVWDFELPTRPNEVVQCAYGRNSMN